MTQVEGHRPADPERTTGSPTPVPNVEQMATRKPEGGVYPINTTKAVLQTQVEGHRPADPERTTGSPTPVPSIVQMATRKPEGGVRPINTS